MRWSEKQTYQFVKLYLRHENLWNSNHEHYKFFKIRLKSYKEIISQFRDVTGIDMSIAELKIKIRSLRSTYMQEVAKIKRRSGPDRVYRSNLRWFPLWHKSFDSINRKALSDYVYEDQQDSINYPSGYKDTTSRSLPVDPFRDEDCNDIFKEETSDLYMNQEHSNRTKFRKRKIKQKVYRPSTDSSDKSFLSHMYSIDSRKEDEFDIYGKYIAAQLRNMDLQEALRIQLEIQSIVSAARITSLVEKD